MGIGVTPHREEFHDCNNAFGMKTLEQKAREKYESGIYAKEQTRRGG